MIRRPQFLPHIRVEVVPGEGVFILSEVFQRVLQGRLYEVVAPLVDGRPIEDICQQLREVVKPAEVIYTVRKLHEAGYVRELPEPAAVASESPASVHESGASVEPGAPHPAVEAMWSLQGVDTVVAQSRLAAAAVVVQGFGVDVDPLRALLDAQGVREVRSAAEAPASVTNVLTIAAVDHYLRPELKALNAESLATGRPLLLVKPMGRAIWLGPLLHGREVGCWECLAHRIRSNNPVIGYLDGISGDQGVGACDLAGGPGSVMAAWGLAAQAVANWIVEDGRNCELLGRIKTFDMFNWHATSHNVLRLPHCPACGAPEPKHEPRPVAVRECRKTFTTDGGHRSTNPEETIRRYEHLVSPICGVVTELTALGSDDGLMHVYRSGHNVGRGPKTFRSLRGDLRNLSAGKGVNPEQAKASALCEALERYSGVYRGDEIRRRGRLDDFKGQAIHPNECMRYSEKQYDERDAINQRASAFHYVPQRFDPDRPVDWSPVWSLTREEFRWLPTAQCYFDVPQDDDYDPCVGCSNGGAAGNTLEEAILQGFLELVERDAVGVWWYNRLSMPGIDLDAFDEPYLLRLREHLKSRNREMWALDLTNDLGVPVFAALSRRIDGPEEHIMFGFGAHLDPKIALLRCVTELNQMLAPLVNSPNGGIPNDLNDRDTVEWLKSATLSTQPYLAPRGDAPLRKSSDFVAPKTDDIREDVRACQRLVESRGLEMLVLDQTRAEVGLPVCKVFVPGLRHFWSRLGSGRLYDAPVQLGWLPSPLPEAQLNPIPMFL